MFFRKSNKPKKCDVFAVQTGDFAGQMFNFVEQKGDNYMFISTPDVKIVEVPIEKFDFAKEHEIIEYVERLPRKIFKVIKKQYQVLADREF
jgi:hypothetical protein